jgi:hypothetical protein
MPIPLGPLGRVNLTHGTNDWGYLSLMKPTLWASPTLSNAGYFITL